jgi:multiple sugar transport system substrate-binding protein
LEFDSPYLQQFVWSGYLRSLEPFVSRADRRDFLPSVLAEGSYGGRIYGLGQYESGVAIWANRRDLRQAGVRIPTLEAPWGLEEFEQTLRKLVALPQLDYAIDMGASSGSGEFFTYAYAPILQSFGGDLPHRGAPGSARNTLAGPQSLLAMQHFQRWFELGWATADSQTTEPLTSGRVALAWNGNWVYADYHRAMGRDLALLPLPDLGHGIKTGTGSWIWGLSSTCRDPAEAGAFVHLLLSPGEIQELTRVNGAIPARQSVLRRSPLYGPRGPLRLFVDQLERGLGVPRPSTPGYGTVTVAFSTAAAHIIAGSDVQKELDTAANRIDAEVKRRHGYPHP